MKHKFPALLAPLPRGGREKSKEPRLQTEDNAPRTFQPTTNQDGTRTMKTRKHTILPLAAAMGSLALATSANAAVIFTEDFEGWDGTTGLAGTFSDGSFTNTTWANSAFTLDNGGNLLRPNPTASAWLNPMPAELGTTFAVIHSGSTATADVGVNFLDNTVYTLTFTQFKRDDTADESITALIATTGGSVLQSDTFAAVGVNDTYLTRTVTWTTNGGAEVSQGIRIQFVDPTSTGTSPQVAIDNIALDAIAVPEPSTAALLGLGGLALLRRRRK